MKRLTVVLLLLSGCGSAASTGARSDGAYENDMDVGRSAFDLSHPDQAQAEYAAAYKRALLRDDARALHDAGYNLAVSELAQNHAQDALDTLTRTRGDLALRSEGSSVDLAVTQAAALYRLGRYQEALDTAQQVSGGGLAVQERADFVAGLAADGLGDVSSLAQHTSAIGAHVALPKAPSVFRADHDELSSRLALRQGRADVAWHMAVDVADRRRDQLDYRGMVRVLNVAANAARQAGHPEVALQLQQQADASVAQDAALKRADGS